MCLANVSAITLDLDDTLWPFAPSVERAERVLHKWLLQHAPGTASVLTSPQKLHELRSATERERPELAHDLKSLRLESIRMALTLSDEDAGLAGAAYEVFFAERQRVELYEDVLPALQWLARRYPLVAVSNGNGCLKAAGVQQFFQADLRASTFGCAKPDAAIFQAAAALAGVAADRVLHVGDDAELDIAGALAAGLQAAWIVRSSSQTSVQWVHGDRRPQLIFPDLRALCRMLEVGSRLCCANRLRARFP
ncbi:HAD-IA family hydrolase [Caldimonas tepidiphila]|uniref:HAD-IA family hydrolase n=1 Tax=Caldimonas tepidiphila TaxID=2315841 RepID=UPI000E5AAA0E|nr:HAD-IA family hydrolase [Caldimonas tepidiphila]